jgi:mevalonate kinase
MQNTASGKVILAGEHAVVYGVPALAVGIDRGARATARPLLPRERARLAVPTWGIEVSEDGDEMLSRAFRSLLNEHRQSASSRKESAFSVEAFADLPPGGGLGCSAAVGVAIARAVDPTADIEGIQRLAMAWERVFHGNPSGIDAACSARGGAIWFRKGEQPRPVRVARELHLCIGHSGIASSTKSMVESVAKQREKRPEVVEKAFSGIAAVVENARLALEAGDVVALGKLLDMNQMLLGGLLLSTEEVETLCRVARGAGALGAKLTGAGGGGCVVALVSDEARGNAVVQAWDKAGYFGFHTRVAATVHSTFVRERAAYDTAEAER